MLAKRSFASLIKIKISNSVIYNTQSSGPIHDHLKYHDQYFTSEYFGEAIASGASINGMRHEDLQALSFKDSSLDIVISTEVFEHIPDPYKAHSEVYRVLRHGGFHVFTVPFNHIVEKDIEYAKLSKNGSVIYLREPMYHKDPIRRAGVLVFNVFSVDMVSKLCDSGFAIKVHQLSLPSRGIIGQGAIVFVATKL
jgi:SAM-dependent methyltransferase